MSPLTLVLLPLICITLLLVRREWLLLTVIAASFWSTLGVGISVGSGYVPGLRIYLFVAALRTCFHQETFSQPLRGSDRFVLGMCAWTLFASFFHQGGTGSGFAYTAGIILSLGFAYYLGRSACASQREVEMIICGLAIILLPVALEMIQEKFTGRNLFGIIFGGATDVLIRSGSLRAAGSFRHPILAGTVGAGCIPLFVALWARHPKYAVAGLLAASTMIITSKSSGPMVSAALGVLTLLFWKRLRLLIYVLGTVAFLYLFINIFSHRPAYYYFLARLDMTGSSTGFYRAYLIDVGTQHLSEWWLIGTDYTLDWLPEGIGSKISDTQIDITNYFLNFGVLGGLPSLCLFICAAAAGIHTCWRFVNDAGPQTREERFFIWCVLAAFVAYLASSLSISYFDQSMLCFWCTLALMSTLPRALFFRRKEGLRIRTVTETSLDLQLAEG